MSRTKYSRDLKNLKKPPVVNNTFYKMVETVHPYMKGDVIVYTLWHNDYVIAATPSKPTQYNVPYHIAEKLDTSIPYEYYSKIKQIVKENMVPLTKREFFKIYPHLTSRIRTFEGKALYDAYKNES